jgi:hypothetical protein
VTDTITTAEPFTMDPIPAGDDVGEDGLPVTWAGTSRSGSRMQLLLRFSRTGATPDEQIACNLTDDGAHTIDATIAEAYADADPRSLLNIATRVRTTTRANSSTRLLILSTYEILVPNAASGVAGDVAGR